MSGPSTYQQIDYLADQLTSMENNMIDPREFGRLENEVAQMRVKQAQMDEKLDLVLTALSEAKGGWRAMMLIGGAGSTLIAGLVWVIGHNFLISPK